MIIKREFYLNKLISSLNNGMVKIITGPRRSGKSFLLFNIFKQFLLENYTDEEHIIELHLDQISMAKYRNLINLSDYFKEQRVDDGKTNYFFIDEIQFAKPIKNPYVENENITFYDILNEFLSLPNTEIFITGSNSHMLSSDIATEFRGRGWQINMHPLSFSEFISLYPNNQNYNELWEIYFRYGGLPQCALMNDISSKIQYLKSTFDTTYINDVIERNNLRQNTIIKDVVRVLASSVGTLVNPTKISDTFKSKEKTTISSMTVKLYIEYLKNSFLISLAQRYDLKGRKFIGSSFKCYFEDLGLRNAACNFKGEDQEPHFMENIIYNELIKRDFQVDIGVIESNDYINGKQEKKQYEVDFIAQKNGKKFYIQSALFIQDESKMMQEKKSLLKINDSFKKIIVTKYSSGKSYDEDGILHVNLFDFLLDPRILED